MRFDVAVIVLTLVEFSLGAELVQDGSKSRVSYLDAGTVVDYQPLSRHRGFFENNLRTYCYRGSPVELKRIFESVELHLDINGDDYTQYEGGTPEEVQEHYEEQRSLFSFSLFSQKKLRVQLSPFHQRCIGIDSSQPYRVRLYQLRIDFWRVIQMTVGVLLFIYAGRLSHNSAFYYMTGVLLGICSSFMLVIWLSSKLVPRRPVMYGVLIGGWTIGIYIIQLLWENLQVIILTYRTYVFWYIIVTGLISFLFCYRLGPPKNKRSKNIIKWLLQFLSLILIYLSSHFEEASIAVVIITAVLYYFPRSFVYKMRALFLRRFPPKRRLLTNEEYYEEGVRETTKALDELRAYASSPECKQWKVMSKLRDPLRFAAFVEGASHLRDEELLRFEDCRQEDVIELDESDDSLEDEYTEQELNQRSTMSNRSRYDSFQQNRNSYRRFTPIRSPREEIGAGDYNDDEHYNDDLGASTSSSVLKMRNIRGTPILNHSQRSSLHNTSMTNPFVARRYSPQSRPIIERALTRSARLVSSAQKQYPSNGSAGNRGCENRSFEMQESSDESEE